MRCNIFSHLMYFLLINTLRLFICFSGKWSINTYGKAQSRVNSSTRETKARNKFTKSRQVLTVAVVFLFSVMFFIATFSLSFQINNGNI